MTVFIVTFVLFALVILAMSVGVLMGRKPIQGSCGGMSALGMDTACDICGGDPKKCSEEQERQGQEQTDLAYDATQEKQ